MKVNQKKLARQNSNIDKWLANGCRGVVEAVTGYGKTYVGILIIKRLHAKYPNVPVDVILPKINLLEDWTNPVTGHIAVHELTYVSAFVVNTYIKFERRFPTLVILDEIHNYASEEFGKVFEIAGIKKLSEITEFGNPPFVLGLTATLERNDGKHSIIEEYCPIIDTVGLEEAKREGYISKFKTYNLGLEYNEKDKEDYLRWDSMFRNAFAKFNRNFELAMACSYGAEVKSGLEILIKVQERNSIGEVILIERMTTVWYTSREWCVWFANQNGWDGSTEHPWSPKKVAELAQVFSKSMRERKLMIYKASVKIDVIEQIINLYPHLKTITFAEDTTFADAVAERLGEGRCKSYHSKVESRIIRVEVFGKNGQVTYKDKKIGKDKNKALIIEEFKRGEFLVLSTVKALDEGFDDPTVDLGIQASYTSSKRQNIQRNGRNTRKDEVRADKMALTVNLYMKDTQEEKWLNDKQRGMTDVEWIDSVEQINFEESMEGNFNLI